MKRTFLALLLAALPSVAIAVPAQLTTQGRILDADENPLRDTIDVAFRLMDSETGGSTLWEETQAVTFTNGFYTVMMGADESGNPLEDSVLDQWPLFLEVQLGGEPAMVPRMAVGSVPYARQAGVAEELAPGAAIDAGSLTVNGTEVVNADGEWAGATPDVGWSDLSGIPGDFADEDDADTLADLVCSDGQWAVWDDDSTSWGCDGFSDSNLTDADVVVAVGSDAVDLFPGSTMDGYTIITADSELDWANLTGVPTGLEDGDDDTLATLSCSDGQVPVWSAAGVAWACGDDTDTTLTASEVVAAVEAAASLALPASTTVGGDTVITTSGNVDWSQLTTVPAGLSDGDNDTLGALSCSGSAIPVYSGTAWTCGTDTDTTLTASDVVAAIDAASTVAMTGTLSVGGYAVLTENSSLDWGQLTGVPSGLADGDDDTLAGLSCSDGEVATYDSSTGWGCASASSVGGGDTVEVLCPNAGTSSLTYITTGGRHGVEGTSTSYFRGWTSVAPTDCYDYYAIDSSGNLRYYFNDSTITAGGSVIESMSPGYLAVDAVGDVWDYSGAASTGAASASSHFSGGGWTYATSDDASGNTTYCGIAAGAIDCSMSPSVTYPTPPSGSNFEEVWPLSGCSLSAPSSTSSSLSCFGAVCGFTTSGAFSCSDQNSTYDFAVPAGTSYTQASGRVKTSGSSVVSLSLCGVTASGDVECGATYVSLSGGYWVAGNPSLTGRDAAQVEILTTGYSSTTGLISVGLCILTADGSVECGTIYQ